jgi:hypothetical protein
MLEGVEISARFATLLDRHFQERDRAGEDLPYWSIPLKFGCFDFTIEYFRNEGRFYLDRATDGDLIIYFDYAHGINHPIYKQVPDEKELMVTCRFYTDDNDEILIKMALGMSETPMFA